MSDKVKVAIRGRPLVSHEIENGAEVVIVTEKEKRVRVAIPARNNSFEFDWSFGSLIPQIKVYNETCRPLIDSFFNGYNATVFAYGLKSFFHSFLSPLTFGSNSLPSLSFFLFLFLFHSYFNSYHRSNWIRKDLYNG